MEYKWIIAIILWFAIAIVNDRRKHKQYMLDRQERMYMAIKHGGKCAYYDIPAPGMCYNYYNCKDCDADQYER